MARRRRNGKNKSQKLKTSDDPQPGTSKESDNPDQPRKKSKGNEFLCKETNDMHANLSMEPALNINSLPREMLLKIFGNLTQNQLGHISSVCQLWKDCVRSPVLWKEVDVKFSRKRIFRSKRVLNFVEKLPSNVTHLKLDFNDDFKYRRLNFVEFCKKLNEKCPNLHKLILYNALFSVDLPSVINLCSDFLKNLKILILPSSSFGNEQKKNEHGRWPEIEILDVSRCRNFEKWNMHSISKIHSLKKLNLSAGYVGNDWFQNNMDISYLQKLEYLNLAGTNIDFTIFRIIQNKVGNLTELFLCGNIMHDNHASNDFNFSSTSFPVLKTICLTGCLFLSCESIVFLVKTCQSLENIYVSSHVAESYSKHPFIAHNPSKLHIVKVIYHCDHIKELGYSLD